MRQIVLDTETTGIEVSQDHRIIEIGAVELVNRRLTGRHFHRYINPQREVEEGAFQVHGISNDFLADKPLFAQIADELARALARCAPDRCDHRPEALDKDTRARGRP